MDFGHREEHTDEGMILIQTNVDDMNPEWCAHVADKLFEAGANDVYWVPIMMKKGRPAYMLNVLTSREMLEKMELVIFSETTTLGIRWIDASCHRLGRSFAAVDTPWGKVTVKIGYYKGKAIQFAPEYADCERIAKQTGIPIKEIYDTVRYEYRKQNTAGELPEG